MTTIKPVDQVNLEPISVSLRSIKLLRSNVKDLFKLLADGNQNGNDSINQPEEESSTNGADFINDLQILMNNINQRVRELETSTAFLTTSNISSATNMGNVTYLGLDPNQDSQQLYNQMIQSYRWCDKLTEAATHAHLILSTNQQKRTTWSFLNNPRSRIITPKKSLTSGYNVSSLHVESFVNLICKQLGLKVEFDNTFGEQPTVMKICLERVLKTVIVLRGFIIEWINVKGINEDFVDDCNETKSDIWSESKYEVFRKVTDHMNSALLHFSSPIMPETALKSFLIWFRSYSTLFDKECKKCGLKLRNYLPPTWREIRTNESYHDVCRQLKPFA